MKKCFIVIFFFWSVGITAQSLPTPAAAVFVNVIQFQNPHLTRFHVGLIEQAQTEVEAGLMASRCYGALRLRIGDEELDKVRDMEGLSNEQIQRLRYGFFVEIREQPKQEPYSLNIKMVELSTKVLVKQVSFNISVDIMGTARERQDIVIKNILNAEFCERKLPPPIEPSPPEPSLSKPIAVRNFKWVGGAIPDTVKMLKCIENGVEQALYESGDWQVLSSTPKNLEYEYIAYGEASYDITTRSYNLVFKISCVSTNKLVCRIVLNIKNCNLFNIEDELQQKLIECTK